MGQGDKPHSSTVESFKNMLNAHSQVERFNQRTFQIFEVERINHPPLVVYLSDLYTIGVADYQRICSQDSDVNCIVCASGYNSYTDDAKAEAKADKRGLFKWGEFMRALRHEQFWAYEPPKESPKDFIGRSAGD